MTYKKSIPTGCPGGFNEVDILASLGAEQIQEPAIPTERDSLTIAQEDYIPKVGKTSGSGGVTSGVEERALSLLGSGIGAEQVAAALGVTPSRIAQLLSVEHFSKQVADLRYANLQKHNLRDEAYDQIEDILQAKLRSAMPLLIKPRDIMDALGKVNAAKRRGSSAPTSVNNQQNVVNLILPTIIAEKFAIDINNQVTKAGGQELQTMSSGSLLKKVEAAEALRLEDRVGDLLDEKAASNGL